MSEVERHLVRASAARELPEFPFSHPLNPESEIHIRMLAAPTGLERVGVNIGRVPPGKESFVYHSHEFNEEFLYVISGRGVVEIGEQEFEVGPGDFMGFPAPGPAHQMRNPFDEELVYLMGGERRGFEVGLFPRHKKRLVSVRNSATLVDDAALEPFVPRRLD
jgi:uncharacterized cupin superfamily protein